MNVLVTGAKGFIGKNLVIALKNRGHRVFEFDVDSAKDMLPVFIRDSDFIVHLAGINRSLSKADLFDVNANFTFELIDCIRKNGVKIPLIFSSSTQAALDNDYGKSKKMGEDFLFDFQKSFGSDVYVYRLTNLFGKWAKPNFNSVVATFCYNISHNLPIHINDSKTEVTLVYIDDVIQDFIDVIEIKKRPGSSEFLKITPEYSVNLGKLASQIESFEKGRKTLMVPNVADDFERKLYATYLSYLDPTDLTYQLSYHSDNRGSFSEFLKATQLGQISVNKIFPGITKGNHYHNTKNEKFLVVQGEALVKLKLINTDTVVSFSLSGSKPEVLDIPPGYTHNIRNVGSGELILLIWASEPFDYKKPDTFPLEIL